MADNPEAPRGVGAGMPLLNVWERFSHQFDNMQSVVYAGNDSSSRFTDKPDTGRLITFGEGDIVTAVDLHPCTDACQHDAGWPTDTEPSRLVLRPDGLVEILLATKANTDALKEVEVCSIYQTTPSLSGRKNWPNPTSICDDCSKFDFNGLHPGIISYKESHEWNSVILALAAIQKPKSAGQPFHKTFKELEQSSNGCAACKVFLSALPDPRTFTSDETRPIILRASARDPKGEKALSYLDVGFPASDTRHPDCRVTRYGKVDLIAAHDQDAAKWPFGIAGRPVLPAENPDQALRWIKECGENHAACRSDPAKGILPTRVICVPNDDLGDPWLEYGNGRAAEYVALSYRWGSAKLSKTLLSNESEYRKAISYCALSKTIQHAILMTRKLGYRYLWVDSLCIIQDSVEDWNREALRMAAVYENAAITFSASVSESADSGIFYPEPDVYSVPLAVHSIEGGEVATFSIAMRSCSSFESDADHGTLSERGWCLQERLLSRRVLHFGASQTHWECLDGVWSASSGLKLAKSTRLRESFLGKLETSIPKTGPSSLLMPGGKLVIQRVKESDEIGEATRTKPPQPQPRLKQLYGHEPHGTWYLMLMDYSARSLTVSTDKLAALAGLASTFARKTGDVYLNGLWLHGLPEGLLWSSIGLGRGTYELKSKSKCPSSRRAPTWSWASLDGPAKYPSGKYTYVDAVVHSYSMPGKAGVGNCCGGTNAETLHFNPDQKLVLKVRLRSLEELRGFRPEERKALRENKDSRGAFLVPHACFDDPDRDLKSLEGVSALFIAQVGCGVADCDHFSDCGAGFAHCLLVEKAKEPEAKGQHYFLRVGVAQCISGEFSGAQKYFITLG